MDTPPTLDLSGAAPAIGYHTFCADESINYQCNRWAQWIGPEAIPALAKLGARASDHATWITGLLELADQARDAGNAYAAAYYDRGAGFFMSIDDPRGPEARKRFVQSLREIYAVSVDRVPYNGVTLPAYDLHPTTQRGAPIVVFGGFDSYIEEFFPLFFALVEQGRRIVAFEGPGQGGALEDEHLPMTPDWGRCVAAVLDHFALTEATAVGISLGGALLMRAAAEEPRLARVVAYDVCDDQLDSSTDRLGAAAGLLRVLLRLHARPIIDPLARAAARRQPYLSWALAQGMRVTGTRTPYGFLRSTLAVETASCSPKIRADVLLLAGADDILIPRRMLHRQATTLTSARSVTTRLFTADEQASSHCQVGNIGLAGRVIDTWITLHEPAATRSSPEGAMPLSARGRRAQSTNAPTPARRGRAG